jgi:hypothetical protein
VDVFKLRRGLRFGAVHGLLRRPALLILGVRLSSRGACFSGGDSVLSFESTIYSTLPKQSPMRAHRPLIGLIARPLLLGSYIALALAGCQADRQGERALITDPQFAVGNPADSLAPLYEMDNPNRLPGRYIVRFEPGVADPQALSAQIVAGQGGRVYEVLHSLKGFWGELPDAAINGLRRNPNVRYIEADVAVPVTGVGDTTQWFPRWPLDRVDQRTLPLNNAYEYSVVGTGVRIWIIDTGVNRNEGDLAGRIDESWYVTNNGKDPHAPCHDHGTRVARVAAGATNGVAKQATIHAARVDVDCTSGSMSTGAASFAFGITAPGRPWPTTARDESAAGGDVGKR